MRRFYSLLLIGVMALMLGACSNPEKAIIGKYQLNIDTSKMAEKDRTPVEAMKGMLSGVTVEFKEDHTAAMNSGMGGNQTGTWKLEGDKLTVTPKTGKATSLIVQDGGKVLAVDAKEMQIPAEQMKGAVITFKKMEK